MKCPRCGLFNPKEAQRCDCGYDFRKGTVEEPYFRQAFPKQLKTALLVLIVWNLVVGISSLAEGDQVRMVVTLCWAGVTWILYALVVTRHYWAYFALIILTFPVGLLILVLANRREVRLYCLQKQARP